MEISSDDAGRIKIALDRSDLCRFGLTYEQVDYQNQKTKNMLRERLGGAKQLTGIECEGEQMLIEVFPAPGGGCIVYFSAVEKKDQPRRLRLKHKTFSPQIFCFAASEDLMSALSAVNGLDLNNMKSELYLLDERYYLTIWSDTNSSVSAVLSEYASSERSPLIMASFLSEHAKLLEAPNALGRLSRLFKG